MPPPPSGSATRLIARGALIAPVAVLLAVPLYAGGTPELLGLPFFYWFLFAVVLLSPVLMGIAHLALRGQVPA